MPTPHLLLDRFIVQPRVMRGHLERPVVQHLLNHYERNLLVDHARPHVVAKQVRVQAERGLAVNGVDACTLDVARDDPIDHRWGDVKRAALAVALADRRGGKQPLGALGVALGQQRLLARQLL